MSKLRTHPQPLLLKREGAKTSSFLSILKVPLFVERDFPEGMPLARVSLLLFTQPLQQTDQKTAQM